MDIIQNDCELKFFLNPTDYLKMMLMLKKLIKLRNDNYSESRSSSFCPTSSLFFNNNQNWKRYVTET